MCVRVLYILFRVIVFFFFKQKTAYEIKECDWSSDVCSSDLTPAKMITVVKKQAPTQTNKAAPVCPNPRQMENINEPNANIVVSEVSKIALPVLAKTECGNVSIRSMRK